jgi:pyruvate/2-oxoglutarate dehydrogenase complex dihydrolipoamide acyltransferase (E2) component
MTQADITIVELKRENGSAVKEGKTVAVIETAKVSFEIKSPASGLIFYLKKVKDKISIGTLLAVVADSQTVFNDFCKDFVPDDEEPISSQFDTQKDEEEWGVHISFGDQAPIRPVASPHPQIANLNLDNRKILNRIPFIGMRRTIAENLVASLQTGAQLTIVSEADMTELANFRKELRLDFPDTRITFVDMLVKILASVLKEYPILNSTVAGDEIICWDEYHIGVAVALDDGLVVPVVRNADKKSLVAVSREIKKLSRKAHQNELKPENYEEGTFTLSSGGKVETEFMTPIINPPQNAILGIGKIGPKPTVHQGELTIRTMTYLCLTHDHRVVDGVPASQFLGRLKEIIEHRKEFSKILK